MKKLTMMLTAMCAVMCTLASVTISVSAKTVQKSGGGGTITVSGTGAWTAVSDSPWITVKSGASGDGDGKVMFTVGENTTADTRIGHINVNDNVYTITQYGYAATISPTSTTVDRNGGSGTINVTTDAGITWTATANVDWLFVTPTSGRSVGSVTYTVAPYPGVVSRSGSITIAGNTFAVTQTGVDVNIEPATMKIGPDADILMVEITALAATRWEVTPNASWISVLDKEQGYGDYDLALLVNANPSFAKRTGTVAIGTATLTVIQDGKPTAELAIDPEHATASPSGAYGNVAVYATPDAPWTARSLTSWLTISQGNEGAGNGNIKYVASANPTLEEREGLIKITPPYKEPELDLYVGLECWIPQSGNTEGNPSRSFASMYFDGTASYNLQGAAFPVKDGDDFTASIAFSVNELDRVNRLMTFAGQSVYLDIENRLIFHETPTDFMIESTNTFYTLLIRQDGKGNLSLYAGRFGEELTSVLETPYSQLFDFSQDVSTGFLKLGYTVLPTSGYLTQGDMKNFRFWIRAVTDEEAAKADTMSGVMVDTEPKYAPSSFAWNYFPMDGNMFTTKSSSANPTLVNNTSSGFYEFNNRYGLRQRAVESGTGGNMYISDVRALFDSNEPNATYSMWFYIDKLPSSGATSLMQRYWTSDNDDCGADNDRNVEVSVLPSGAIQLDNNGSITSYDTIPVLEKRWYLLTLVGTATKTLQVYLDDTEIGNVSSATTLGYGEWDYYYYRWWCYYGTGNNFMRGVFGGGACAIDDLVIYHQALTSAQVRELYEASKPKVVYHRVTQGIQSARLSETNMVIAAAGANSSVQLTLAQGVNWTATANCNWLHITSDTEGAGSSTIAFTVDSTPLVVGRTGTMTIAGITLTVEQIGLEATVTCDKTFFDSVESDIGFISVCTEGAGQWTAVSNDDWIQIDPETEYGNGAGNCWFYIDDYPLTTQSRTGSITIAGKTVYITQSGYRLSIDPMVADVGSNAGAGEIGVAASIDQVWEVITDCDWITIVNGRNGIGNGTVQYQFTDNTTGETRTGTIIIGGQKYTLTQRTTLPLTTAAIGNGTITGSGNYNQGASVTLTATPQAGDVFSHWQGDAVGVSNQVTLAMDVAKNVSAVFIPESAAEQLAAAKAAQGGFYTRDQIHALEVGNLVLDVDSASGTARVGVKLMETSNLSDPNSWHPVGMTTGNLDVGSDGTVGLNVPATGNAKFFKVVVPEK